MAAAETWVPAVAEAARLAGVGEGVIEALVDVHLSEVMRTRALSHAVSRLVGLRPE